MREGVSRGSGSGQMWRSRLIDGQAPAPNELTHGQGKLKRRVDGLSRSIFNGC